MSVSTLASVNTAYCVSKYCLHPSFKLYSNNPPIPSIGKTIVITASVYPKCCYIHAIQINFPSNNPLILSLGKTIVITASVLLYPCYTNPLSQQQSTDTIIR